MSSQEVTASHDHERRYEDSSDEDPHEWLHEALLNYFDDKEVGVSVYPFSELGLLTQDEGFVVKFADSEFHLTVRQAR